MRESLPLKNVPSFEALLASPFVNINLSCNNHSRT
jgi:hypothetical protein